MTLERWRTEIKPEIEAMTDLAPKHPSLKGSEDWVCHLVVNGNFKGEATREIVDTQEARKKKGQKGFDTVVQGQLLRAFSDAYGKYLPHELDDFTFFIDAYREDGREPVNKAALAKLIEAFLNGPQKKGQKAPSKNTIKQKINAAMVSMSYLLANKYKQENHTAILEGWLLLLNYILATVEKNNLEKKYWESAVHIIEQIIDNTIKDLTDEIDKRLYYAESGALNPYADAYVYKIRVTIVGGYLAAYCTSKRMQGAPSSLEPMITKFLDELLSNKLLVIKGEGQIRLLANISIYYHLTGNHNFRNQLLIACIDAILVMRDKGGLYDPYIDVQDIIKSEIGLTLTPIERHFGGNSYVLHGLLILLTYFNERQLLEERWRTISYISFQEFKPTEKWQWFLWHSLVGKQEGRFPNQTQSWKELVTHANTPDTKIMPKLGAQRPYYLPLLFCLMPHRMSGYAMRTLTSNLPKPKK